MKNLIENSISWERLGRHPKSEYGFSIERAVMSKETGILTIDIRANFVMPYEDVLKIRAIVKSEVPALKDVKLEFVYDSVIQTEEEIIRHFIEHMIAIVNGKYHGMTKTIVTDEFELTGDLLNIFAVGQTMCEQLNRELGHTFEQLLSDNFGINCSVSFLNHQERYEESVNDICCIEAEAVKKAMEAPPRPKKAASEKPAYGGGGGGFRRRSKEKDVVEGNKIMGRRINSEAMPMLEVTQESGEVTVEGIVFKLSDRTIREGLKLVTILVTDKRTTMCVKCFVSDEKAAELAEHLSPGTFAKIRGMAEWDTYDNVLIVKARDIEKGEIKERKDTSEDGRRVELHLHTKMSSMDGLNDAKEVVKQAIKWGHPAIAITDHGVVQSFPDAASAAGDKIKVIYGMEGYLLDDAGLIDEEGNIDYKARGTYHIILLARTQEGLKNIYKLVSLSHLDYFYRRPRIPRSVLEKHREGIIIGAACEAGEVYCGFKQGKSDDEIREIAKFYDYLEIQPLINNRYLVEDVKIFPDNEALRDVNRRIVAIADSLGKMVCATTDSHYTNPEDAIYRNILFAGQGYKDAESGEGLYFRTTDEMLEEFSYLGEGRAREVVITNTNAIADSIDDGILPVPKGKFPPHIDGAEETLRKACAEKLHEIYGDNVDPKIQERLDKELNSIIGNGYAVMYVSAQMLVNKSLSDGYLVGSRGSVGSSFAATMAGITEVNPLPPHYVCPECKHLEWGDNAEYDCGVDMPEKSCPKCGARMDQLGFTIPFETFLGFEGDKEPDIDLNFAGEYQGTAHKFVGDIFGEKNVFKAGTVGTVAEKTAFGFVKKFYDEREIDVSKFEVERLAANCTGVKRTTGQHPGGIIIVPDDHEIYEFCPVQHPANDTTTDIITTHFDYHKIDQNLLKLDILGHDVPSMIRHLQDMTGVDPLKVQLKDEKVNSIFLNCDALDIRDPDYRFVHGSFGIPEFGTKFTRQMLDDTQPSRFGDLVRISGFSHGTDVWINNAQEFIKNGDTTIKDAISTRDDIMNYLILKGLPNKEAFNIMEKVRKGKGVTEERVQLMKDNNVPDWYIESCQRIKYMFPRAHAVAYVMMSYRIAWFKVYYPVPFYAAYFTTKVADFNSEVVLKGSGAILARIDEILAKGKNATKKEEDEMTVLEVAYEMYSRGYEFEPINFGVSDGTKFYEHEGRVLLPFMAVSGIGETAAKALADECRIRPFETIEELKSRTRISNSNIESLKDMGVLEGMPETDQLSMF